MWKSKIFNIYDYYIPYKLRIYTIGPFCANYLKIILNRPC